MILILILLQITGSGMNYEAPPTVLGTGGPDAYGYRWIDSDTTGGPTYSWVDISSIGTEITGLGDDNVVGPFSIGFDFPYYWYTVNSFFVGSNGYIAFDDNTLEAAPFPRIPVTAKPNNLLAALMSDLDFSSGNPIVTIGSMLRSIRLSLPTMTWSSGMLVLQITHLRSS